MEKTKHLDDIANKYHETKDPKYKKLWYQLIKEFENGTYYPKRRFISTSNDRTDRCNRRFMNWLVKHDHVF